MNKNTVFKEYWYLWLVVILTPIALYCIIMQPWGFDAIGGEEAPKVWLGFWGGYLGSIISASAAFFILDKQIKNNDDQNERNRILQVNVMMSQQQQERLTDFKEVAVDYISALNTNNLVSAVNLLEYFPNKSYDETKKMFVDLGMSKAKMDFYKSGDTHIHGLVENLNTWYDKFSSATNDIHKLSVLRQEMKENPSIDIRQYINNATNDFSEEIKGEVNHIAVKLDVKQIVLLAKKRCSSTNNIFIDVSDLIQRYIIDEQNRINSILLT